MFVSRCMIDRAYFEGAVDTFQAILVLHGAQQRHQFHLQTKAL